MKDISKCSLGIYRVTTDEIFNHIESNELGLRVNFGMENIFYTH